MKQWGQGLNARSPGYVSSAAERSGASLCPHVRAWGSPRGSCERSSLAPADGPLGPTPTCWGTHGAHGQRLLSVTVKSLYALNPSGQNPGGQTKCEGGLPDRLAVWLRVEQAFLVLAASFVGEAAGGEGRGAPGRHTPPSITRDRIVYRHQGPSTAGVTPAHSMGTLGLVCQLPGQLFSPDCWPCPEGFWLGRPGAGPENGHFEQVPP